MDSILSLVISVGNIFLRGHVIKTFWTWFILTLFPGLPALTVMGAIGLSMMLGIFHAVRIDREDLQKYLDGDRPEWHPAMSTLMASLHTLSLLVMWFMGWLIHCMMVG